MDQRINITRVDHFPPLQMRWNTNQDVAQILCSVASHPEWITAQVCERPTSGSQLLFKRFDGNYFKIDGYEWKRRREGKLIREDHMKLKVQKHEIISANYVHSAVVPTFHRRVYWLTQNPDIVLVHYLNCPDDDRDGRSLSDRIAQCTRSSGIQLTHDQLLTQISPILSPTMAPPEVTAVCNESWNLLNDVHYSTPQQHGTPSSSNHTGKSSGCQLERRNSCSSAFRRGLSSVALRRQPSTFSDSVDTSFIGVVDNYPKDDGRSVVTDELTFNNGRMDTQSHSGETHRSSIEDGEASQWRSVCSTSIHQEPSHSAAPSSSNEIESGRLSAITDVTPSTAPLKGGTKVLIVGGWYMKGHDYTVMFGDRRVPSRLIQVGVLATNVPPGQCLGTVPLRVLCDGQIVSSAWQFTYVDSMRTESLTLFTQSFIDRMHLFMAAFNVSPNNNEQIVPCSNLDENDFINLARSLISFRLTFPQLLHPHPSLHTRTLLHFAAALDYHRFIEYLLWWRRQLPYYIRELDPVIRDSEGNSPLHIAVCAGHIATSRVLVKASRETLDVMDERGRLPSDLTSDPGLARLTFRTPQGDDQIGTLPTSIEDVEHVTSTALWVETGGRTVTNELKQNEGREEEEEDGHSSPSTSSMLSGHLEGDQNDQAQPGTSKKSGWIREPLHVEISMDTDVHVPDSPKMADLFQAVTSPGVLVNDGARAKMLSLAQQIIDALPERIKNECHSFMDVHFAEERGQQNESNNYNAPSGPFLSNTPFSSEFDELLNPNNFFPQHNQQQQQQDQFISKAVSPECIDQSTAYRHLCPSAAHSSIHHTNSSFSSSRATTFESTSFDFDKDLGEFFNIDIGGVIDPIQQRLGDLKLSDNEQREVYGAATVIQKAYRDYRERITYRRQTAAENERKAAVTIQSCYRRYKQFCYIKKLHNAAILVQKHFRMKKKDQKSGEGNHSATDELPEHPRMDGQSIRIQVPPNSSSLLREHRAAATIQHAYRGHRKRQAAARKIQKFMKQSRIKLRKMHESSNGVDCSTHDRLVGVVQEDGVSSMQQDAAAAMQQHSNNIQQQTQAAQQQQQQQTMSAQQQQHFQQSAVMQQHSLETFPNPTSVVHSLPMANNHMMSQREPGTRTEMRTVLPPIHTIQQTTHNGNN